MVIRNPEHKKEYGFLGYQRGNDYYCVVFERVLTDWSSKVFQVGHVERDYVETKHYYIFKNGKLQQRYTKDDFIDETEEFEKELATLDSTCRHVVRMIDREDALSFLNENCGGLAW